MFYIKTANLRERTKLLAHLSGADIGAVFHYVPLHTSKAGKRFGEFIGEDQYTTSESDRLIRLPLYYRIEPETIEYVVKEVFAFYGQAFVKKEQWDVFHDSILTVQNK
jgi:dTDP-4-amino-4,6-dideoxygalactose transaminase